MADKETSSRFLHIFAGERLQAFSDAVYAIIATLMVIPLKINNDRVQEIGIDKYDLETFLTNQWSKYLVYLYSFSLVIDSWYTHSGVFSLAEQVDDVLIWLNLLCLLLVSFLPYATGLVSSFPVFDTSKAEEKAIKGEHLSVTICSSIMVLIGAVMLWILLYLFKQWQLLHPDVKDNSHQSSIRRAAVISLLVSPCMALLAVIFSFIPHFPYIGLVIFYSISMVSSIARAIIFYYFKRKNITVGSGSIITSIVSKCRTEAFSDGLFSIVATLIVLDLTTEGIPNAEKVKDHHNGSLNDALYDQRFVFSSYILSFIVVGLLWFVHYGMMHFVKQLTPLLSTINMSTLFLVGVIPFVSGINTIFSDTPIDGDIDVMSTNKLISIRAFCIVIFLVGIGQLLFWTVAIWYKNYCLTSDVDKYMHESLQFCKILIFPVISFITFWGTFSSTFLSYRIYDVLFFSTPFLFLILKGTFRKHTSRVRAVKRAFNAIQRKVKGRRNDEEIPINMPLQKPKDEAAVC